MKKLTKKLSVVAIAVVMLMSLSACSKDAKAIEQTTAQVTTESTVAETTTTAPTETTSTAGSAASVSENDTVPEDEIIELKEDEKAYADKLQSIFSDIQAVTSETTKALDPENLDAVREAMKAMVDKTKPLYEQMGKLEAPAKFTEAQKKISEGVDAHIRSLEIVVETMLLTENDTEKRNALASEANELKPKSIIFSEGLEEVLSELTKN